MNNNRFGLFTLLLVFLNSCDVNNDSLIVEMDKKTFEEERILWNSQNIKHYQFVMGGIIVIWKLCSGMSMMPKMF
jgi:hypothetical protein